MVDWQWVFDHANAWAKISMWSDHVNDSEDYAGWYVLDQHGATTYEELQGHPYAYCRYRKFLGLEV